MEMSSTNRLLESEKPLPQPRAQVIALDPRLEDRERGGRRYVRMLQLSDLLSRHLEVDQIVDAFMTEIAGRIDYHGYRFACRDVESRIERGITDGTSASYRLKLQNRFLGELTLFRSGSFASRDLCELEDLLCCLIYPLKNALLYQIALKSAYRDPITGLNNRTSMEKYLPREIDLARRHQQPMALLVMDLDGFKQINDRSGHDTGDRVLRETARLISGAVRNTDLVYRYGGDEFVGALAQTDIHGAVDVSERIRSSIEALDLEAAGVAERLSVSIGITLVRSNDDFLSAFKRADKALYQAKLNGKNQIIIC